MPFTIPKEVLEFNPRVAPIRNGKKFPTIAGWQDTTTRAKDLVDEDGLFDCDDHDAYGIVIDDDLIVIDIDVHEGQADGYTSLRDLSEDLQSDIEGECGLAVKTPSGGMHLYFHKDESVSIGKKCARFPSIDMLQTGAQVVGPNSRDGQYKIIRSEHFISSIDIRAIEKEWSAQPAPVLSSDYDPVHIGSRDDSPVDDFNRSEKGLYTLIGELRNNGYTVTMKDATSGTFTRPGKTSAHTISGTIGGRSKSGNFLLRNFSTSDPNFPSEESVSIAHAYGILSNCTGPSLPPLLRQEGFGSNNIDRAELAAFAEAFRRKPEPKLSGKEIDESYPTLSLSDLLGISKGERREYVIDGLLRRGEVMNLIAAPKMGKSFMVYNLAISLASGGQWMGYVANKPVRVLIADNELHEEELAHRVGQVANGLGVDVAEISDRLHFTCLRGSDVDVAGLTAKLEEVGGERFDIIVIDALYRILPKGASENSNSDMTSLYNRIDALAAKNSAAVICVHHTSKGNQSEKSVADVGSGAGAISRAADTHLVIRPHAEDGYCVIDAITRSGKSPKPVTGKFDFPLWSKADVDPELATFEAKGKRMNDDRKEKAEELRSSIMSMLLDVEPRSRAALQKDCRMITSKSAFHRHLKILIEEGSIEVIKSDGAENGWLRLSP